MREEEKINPGHTQVRGALRTIGPCILAVGGILTLIGLGSFFSSFGTFNPPRYFWCAFLGMPLMALGAGLTKFGYMGAVARYVAGEAAPVGKDTFNYIAEGTQDGVRTVAGAIREGFTGVSAGTEIQCSACSQTNDANAKFCSGCGAAVAVMCGSCDTVNDTSARFCDNCGASLT